LTVAIGSASYYTTTAYDPISGKVTAVRAFSGFSVVYAYATNHTGYLWQIDDAVTPSLVYWQANARDAELHLTQSAASNGVVTTNGFDPATGRMLGVCATNDTTVPCDGDIANLGYGWDNIGNLTSRTDMLAVSGGLSETFQYDVLNRLTNAPVLVNGVSTPHGVSYDALGDITKKVGLCGFVGCLTYGNPAHVHAVTSVSTSGGVFYVGLRTPNFYYDAVGNLLCVTSTTSCSPSTDAESVSWTASNMVSTIAQGASTSLAYSYNPEHERVIQSSMQSGSVITTSYLNDSAANVMTENVHVPGVSNTWKTYIVAEGHIVAQRVTVNGSLAPPTMDYFVLDHLGSVAVITDGTSGSATYGSAVERKFYDAWGKQRNADGTADSTCSLPTQSLSTRGFTNQEQMQMSGACLVNLNARIYDPALGRFLSADPTLEAPYNLQDCNRYSYVGNNPLSFSDPSGLCFLGCFWQSSIFRAVAEIIIAYVFDGALTQFEEVTGLGTELGDTAPLVNAGLSSGAAGFAVTGRFSGALNQGLWSDVRKSLGLPRYFGRKEAIFPIRVSLGHSSSVVFSDIAYAKVSRSYENT
jgi:RHS repeat-associated protein